MLSTDGPRDWRSRVEPTIIPGDQCRKAEAKVVENKTFPESHSQLRSDHTVREREWGLKSIGSVKRRRGCFNSPHTTGDNDNGFLPE